MWFRLILGGCGGTLQNMRRFGTRGGGYRPAPPPGRSVWGGPPRGPLRPGGLSLLLDAFFLGAKSR
jgi:hypothetical protein